MKLEDLKNLEGWKREAARLFLEVAKFQLQIDILQKQKLITLDEYEKLLIEIEQVLSKEVPEGNKLSNVDVQKLTSTIDTLLKDVS